MGAQAQRIPKPKKTPAKSSSTNAITSVLGTYTAELVIVLCGPIGTNLEVIAQRLEYVLSNDFGYQVVPIKMSSLISKNKNKIDKTKLKLNSKGSKKYRDKKEKIAIGNELRSEYGNSILAELAIDKIIIERIAETTDSAEINFEEIDFEGKRRAYIINSIKNEDELKLFRYVYRDLVYVISSYSPLEKKLSNLEAEGMSRSEIFELIDVDSGEEIGHGQKVGKILPEGDFFISLDDDNYDAVKDKLRRFLNLIFGTKVITPTSGENSMHLATSAAANSACLSRQVGACLTDNKGEVLSVGWNDVPKYKGGFYKDSLDPDHRCMKIKGGTCINDLEKDDIIKTIIDDLIKDKVFLNKEKTNLALDILNKSKIRRISEFSRSIHAEMHALITGCQNSGKQVNQGKMYITTYPCHTCARHLILAGIEEIYYIEPYRKSLTTKLYWDSISETEEKDKVKLRLFDGVGPSRYVDLFKVQKDSRKEMGKFPPKNKKKEKPSTSISLKAIPYLEQSVAELIKKKFSN